MPVFFFDSEEISLVFQTDVSLGFAGHSNRIQNPQDILEEEVEAGARVAAGLQKP